MTHTPVVATLRTPKAQQETLSAASGNRARERRR